MYQQAFMRSVIPLLILCILARLCAAGIGNQGVAINGTVITSVTAANALACASACDLQATCQAWSLNTSSSTLNCQILSYAAANVAQASSISSARLGEVGVYRNGTIGAAYVLAAGSTASACANLCTNASTCVAWNFNTSNLNCTLLTAIPANTSNVASMTSGVQGVLNLDSPYFGINTVILGVNTTATQCSRFCFATAGCIGWVYQPPTANSACSSNGGPITNAGMCWAKGQMYAWPSTSSCYVTGYQPKSTAVAPVIKRVVPSNITAGLPNVTFPFNNIVAFGDNLSDNGNGSYAHCVASPGNCQNSIYGARTWTDGPIAVSYLASYLNMNLTLDYAFGHANGGSKFGATVDNNFTLSPAGAPDAGQQVLNYTTTANLSNIAKTLHFLWIGSNDIQIFSSQGHSINMNSKNNTAFANNFTVYLTRRIQSLINAGAKYIFVPNIYPKQFAPLTSTYWTTNATQVANIGIAISQTNAAINASIASFASSGATVIYHDVYTFMLNMYLNASSVYGITHTGGEFCDGYSQLDWELCFTDAQYGHLDQTFFWMQYFDMTSYVHNFVAANMYKSLVNYFR